jgi:hypothetical protein
VEILKIKKDIELLKRSFPGLEELRAVTVPTTLVGTVTLPELLSFPGDIRENYSLPIRVVYPFDFPDRTIKVYDDSGKIDWSRIPEKHRHYHHDGSLCTHHDLEIAKIKSQNRSFMIVYNAVKLFIAYTSYLSTGEWILKDLPHGYEAARQEILRIQEKRFRP